MDKQKSTLLDAYLRKIVAIGKLGLLEAQSAAQREVKQLYSADEIDGIYTEAGKFSDYNDPKVIYLSLWHAFLNQHYGRMTKILQKMYEEKPQREVLEELQLVSKANKWDHISDLSRKSLYRPIRLDIVFSEIRMRAELSMCSQAAQFLDYIFMLGFFRCFLIVEFCFRSPGSTANYCMIKIMCRRQKIQL